MNEPAGPQRPWYKSPFFFAAIAMMILIPVLRPLGRRVPDPPAKIGQIPAFSLIDQKGQPFDDQKIKGKVWVATFFFTSCTSICPRLMAQAKKLQDLYKRDGVEIHLVSFTVDPETDTPEKLTQYAQKIGADTATWTFVTGEQEKIYSLIRQGFMTHVGDKETDGAGVLDIAHGARFMLVDSNLGLRGTYESTDLGVDEVFHRSQHVLRAKL